MSPRARFALAMLGLLIILFSLAALAYAYRSTEHSTERIPIAPTLFVPPQSAVRGWVEE